MKQVIEGRAYDTENADEVCDLPSTQDRSDFACHSTKLYWTANKRFFLAGSGGPKSMWRESAGQNSWQSGSGIRVVSDQEARQYMEAANCSAELFLEFGLPVEPG